MPSVGNDALLKRVHRDCYESLRNDPEHARRLRDLEAAYPDGEYDEGVDEMLADALTYCRDRRLSTEAFRSELEQTRDSAYPGGKPDSFDDIVRSVERFANGDENASEGTGERVRETVIGPDRERLLDADRELYDAWGRASTTSVPSSRRTGPVTGPQFGSTVRSRTRTSPPSWTRTSTGLASDRTSPSRSAPSTAHTVIGSSGRTGRGSGVWSSTRHRTCLPSSTPRSRTS